MKIAIIGAGFTGLAAAKKLAAQGHSITVFEKGSVPGGLAVGYKEDGWEWTLEKFYHHWFTNDKSILTLAQDIHHSVVVRTPYTNWFINNKIYQFVSIKAALTFPLLTPFERVRQLAALGFLRLNPFWKPLEKFKVNEVMPKLMGKKTYDMLWKSILINKFGTYAQDISLAWFWARIKKRTQSLAYPTGGFLAFANHLAKSLQDEKVRILFNTEITEIKENDDKSITLFIAVEKNTKKEVFDKVIVTLPSFLFLKMTPGLPKEYREKLSTLKGLGALNLILRLKKPFFSDNTYWLSVADTTAPIMAIVEHTHFMDKKHYNNEHIVYLGNYLSPDSPEYHMSKEQLLKLFDPFLKKINSEYKDNLIACELFRAPFAQPIVSTNYSTKIPPHTTPLKNVYLANIEQVYPWDRGTNYAVELGEKIAAFIQK